jgi:hypothetical protein
MLISIKIINHPDVCHLLLIAMVARKKYTTNNDHENVLAKGWTGNALLHSISVKGYIAYLQRKYESLLLRSF